MSKPRVALLILIVLLLSTALDLGGTYVIAKTPSGQAMLRDFLVMQSKATLAAQRAAATSTAVVATSTQPGILPIPKTYATQDYFVAINNILQDLFALNAVNTQMGSVMDTLNQQTLSCSFGGFYEAMGQAHQLADKSQMLVSQLTFHLTALAAANTQTKDAITKADTQKIGRAHV